MMSPLNESGRVLVLGAGASAFAGYPVAAGLLPFVRNHGFTEANSRRIASEIFEKLNDAEFQFSRHVVRDPSGTANLEQLLTYLELYGSFPGTQFSLNPWCGRDSDCIRRVVTDAFLEYQYDLNKRLWERPTTETYTVGEICAAWGNYIRPGDTILTFNWDVLHEIILWRSKLWSYRDGYGFECENQGFRDETSRTLMFKLHGSVNWVQEHEYENVKYIAHVKDFFWDSRDWDWRAHHSETQSDSGRKLVLPTYLKDISSNRALQTIWTNAHRILVEARELIVVGYSLNRVDHPARLLFGIALSENPGLDHVTVVSPDASEWAEFLSGLDKKLIHIRGKFEDWVRKGNANPAAV
jgi:hypothetical protein